MIIQFGILKINADPKVIVDNYKTDDEIVNKHGLDVDGWYKI